MATDKTYPIDSSGELPAPVAPQEAQPVIEQKPVLQQGSEVNPEFLPAIGAAATQQHPQQQVAQQPQDDNQQQSPIQSSTPKAGSRPAEHDNNPELAEDVDLIEKEWVDKAKAIVNHTKDDPYNQNKEINKMKADYIKKRYNKDIQVGE